MSVSGSVQGVGFRDETVRRAADLGVMGWVRHEGDGVLVHAEGAKSAIESLEEFLGEGPPEARVEAIEVEPVKVEGHEQFAIRGVSAGTFVVQEHAATAHHFDLRLEVDGVMKSWAVPKGPSMDPATKRLAVEVEDHEISHNEFEGSAGGGHVIVWDRGRYEQGGRVPWPEALERGHAVFVLHGDKLQGGFALQRTRPGQKPQWLLIKRRDEDARPGSDVTAERPESVLSGRSLRELAAGRRLRCKARPRLWSRPGGRRRSSPSALLDGLRGVDVQLLGAHLGPARIAIGVPGDQRQALLADVDVKAAQHVPDVELRHSRRPHFSTASSAEIAWVPCPGARGRRRGPGVQRRLDLAGHLRAATLAHTQPHRSLSARASASRRSRWIWAPSSPGRRARHCRASGEDRLARSP